MKKLILIFFILFFYYGARIVASDNISDNLTLPHTFNSGETISSSKMNENFNKITNLLDNISKRIPQILIGTTGQIILQMDDILIISGKVSSSVHEQEFQFDMNFSEIPYMTVTSEDSLQEHSLKNITNNSFKIWKSITNYREFNFIAIGKKH